MKSLTPHQYQLDSHPYYSKIHHLENVEKHQDGPE